MQQLNTNLRDLMRKPRDLDSDLKALNERAKLLKERQVRQLGELVIATGANVLAVEELAGVLLAAANAIDADVKEGWRRQGAAFFQRTARGTAGSADRGASRGAANDGGAKPPAAGPGSS